MHNTNVTAMPQLSEMGKVSDFTSGKQPVAAPEVISYPTTYGSVLSFISGADALSSGCGICIGEYFVGLSENPHSPVSSTYIRY